MPAQDRVRGDQAMATQRSGQPPDEGGEHGPVRPVQAWSWVGAAQHGDLVAQHEELDVLGGGRAAHQQDQSEHLPEDQVQQPQRHAGDHAQTSDHRWSATQARLLAPHRFPSGSVARSGVDQSWAGSSTSTRRLMNHAPGDLGGQMAADHSRDRNRNRAARASHE